ncbi:MAG: tetratricopeptide repeat protein [Candidatus Aegiribacteria sp.]|nr:tetratricopeptide repeat protein [Candidatus Aegiribacteria sp.]
MDEISEKKDPAILLKILPDTDGLERIKVLAELTVAFKANNPQKAADFGKQGLELLRETENRELESFILNELCWICQCLGEHHIALEFGIRNLDIISKNDNEEKISNAFNNIGSVYWRLARFDQALEYYLKALRILENLGDKQGIAIVSNNIGVIYNAIGDKDSALDFYNRAIKINEELNSKNKLATSLNNAGVIYLETKGEHEKALEYYQRALEIREKLGNKWRIPHSLTNIGVVLKEMKDYSKSLEYFFRSLEIAEKIGNRHVAATTLTSIGEVYLLLDNFDKAQEYVMRGLAITEEIDAPDLKRNCCEVMSGIFEKKGDFREALKYNKQFKEINDRIFTEESSKKYNELQISYETAKKEKENEIYRLRNIELVKANEKLTKALAEVKTLSGLLPICSSCKKIRDDSGYWEQIEKYITERSDTQFSHGICPECMKKLYPEYKESHG